LINGHQHGPWKIYYEKGETFATGHFDNGHRTGLWLIYYLSGALKAEGVPSLIEGYTNIHLLPIFSEVAVNPSSGFPWVNASENAKETYKVGACPIAEEFYNSSFIGLHMCSENFDRNDIKLIVQAFEKVWRKLGLILR
jgi:hypothetical protein